MSNQILDIEIEVLSESNLHQLTKLTMRFWQGCNYEEELLKWKQIINSSNNFVL